MALIEELGSGFADKVRSAQSTFRAVMDAMARPGTTHRIVAWLDAPPPLTAAAAAIALTLFDHDTTIWLDETLAASSHIARWLRFHTSAPITREARFATYAMIGDPEALPDLETFALGTDEYPDRSTTLILQLETLAAGPELQLTGPGIKDSEILRATGLPADLVERLARNQKLFPRGVDLILVAGDGVAALPRTVRVAGMEG
jgi:alpha-D-ribose 1-methylphosphonate 5-triphosphate synthase subunit PhnH